MNMQETEPKILEQSPYRSIFGEIENMEHPQPHEAYEIYRKRVAEQDLDPYIYLSMAITTGGYARESELSSRQAILKNSQFGSKVAQTLVQQYSSLDVETDSIIVPSDFRKVEGWGQSQYLLFWSHVITGLHPSEAKWAETIAKRHNADQANGFTDPTLSKEEKWADYKNLIDIYTDTIERVGLGTDPHAFPHNIRGFVTILDVQQSLGVNAERYLCHRLGFAEWRIDIGQLDKDLEKDLEEIARLGADSMEVGDPTVLSGNQNLEAWARLMGKGHLFQKSGILNRYITRPN